MDERYLLVDPKQGDEYIYVRPDQRTSPQVTGDPDEHPALRSPGSKIEDVSTARVGRNIGVWCLLCA